MPTLRPYQEEAVNFLAERGRGIYADPPGTGKTGATLAWLEDTPGMTLIVAPLSVLGHWEREARAWYPDLLVVRGDGSPKRREQARQEVAEAGRPDGPNRSSALLLHYEAMRSDVALLQDMGWDTIVFDEAHRLKGRNTLTSKAAILLARRTDHLALLTGTPIMNRAEELWSLLRLIDPKGYRSFWRWAHHYFETEVAYWIKSPQPVTLVKDVKDDMLDELRQEVLPTLIQRPMEVLLPDLPEVEVSMVPVRLLPRERKLYDALEKHSWVQRDDGSILQVSNEVSKISRQRQLSSDFSSLFDGGAPASKAAAAVELIENLEPEQVVVMCAYKHTVDSIVHALGNAAVAYNGNKTANEREDALRQFRDGSFRVLVGTQATLGEGVDGLQVARHLVMVDRDWTPARNDQAIGRLQRSGQRGTVVVHHIFAEGTIDETVALTNEHKQTMIDTVLGGATP